MNMICLTLGVLLVSLYSSVEGGSTSNPMLKPTAVSYNTVENFANEISEVAKAMGAIYDSKKTDHDFTIKATSICRRENLMNQVQQAGHLANTIFQQRQAKDPKYSVAGSTGDCKGNLLFDSLDFVAKVLVGTELESTAEATKAEATKAEASTPAATKAEASTAAATKAEASTAAATKAEASTPAATKAEATEAATTPGLTCQQKCYAKQAQCEEGCKAKTDPSACVEQCAQETDMVCSPRCP